jgi:hypothetical protein
MPVSSERYATTDLTRWGAGENRPLSAHEHDESHFALSERIRELEDNPPVAVSIASVTQSGSQITFHLSNGGALTPVTLPHAVFQERGAWRAGRDYRALDIVRVGGKGRFMVLKAHHSVAPFDPDRVVSGGPAYYLLEETGVIFEAGLTASRDLDPDADIFRYRDVLGTGDTDPTIEITVQPEGTDFPWNDGDTAQFETHGAHIVFVEGDGVTIRRRVGAELQSATDDGSVVTIIYKGDDVWTLTGDLLVP